MLPDVPVQLIRVPPKPSCDPNSFDGGTCRDTINAYNQALAQRQAQDLQLYNSRQNEQASAPLQQQIANQQTQMKNLRLQVQSQAVAASGSVANARREGLLEGVVLGLVLISLAYAVRRLVKGFTVS